MPAKKQITRDMILSAAIELLRRGGIAAVNIKALAAELGCSTQPVYLSFSGMDELRRALIPEAVRYFTSRLEAGTGGPARLYEMPYIMFALEEKELFKFLFMRKNAFSEVWEALSPITEQAISELMLEYGIGHDDAHYFHDQLWMHAHGIAAMIATQFCDWDLGKISSMLSDCKTYLGRRYSSND